MKLDPVTRAKKKPEASPRRKKHPGGRPRKQWLDDYEKVGPPPEDLLDGPGYGMKLLLVALDKLRTDKGINERERLREMRITIRMMKDLVPRSRIRKAEQTILGYYERLTMGGDEAETEKMLQPATHDIKPIGTTYRAVKQRQAEQRMREERERGQ